MAKSVEEHKKYKRDYMRQWGKNPINAKKRVNWARRHAREKQKWWNEFKKTTPPCIECGEKDWRCIDYHHTDPTTKETERGGISQCANRGWSKERILAEVEKCVPLCANCHRMEHTDEPKNKGVSQRKTTMPTEEELAEMTRGRRYYWRNQSKLIEKKNQRIKELLEWFRKLKTDAGCSCGENRYQCLDHHHRDPNTKKHRVSEMPRASYSKESILEEIEKCDLLCANCHRKHHHKSSAVLE